MRITQLYLGIIITVIPLIAALVSVYSGETTITGVRESLVLIISLIGIVTIITSFNQIY